jgi:Ran GTPase-activating protein (RanGAP) involved in mRNA processing and transport
VGKGDRGARKRIERKLRSIALCCRAKHIVRIHPDGEEVTLSHDGAAATRAQCLICLEEVSTLRRLACPEGHLICSACLQRYICSLAGSAKLRCSNGALDCLGAHQQAFSFGRSMVEPLLFGDALRLYLETMETTETPETTETTETPGEGEVQCTPESIQPELHKALNLGCPSCKVFCDPDPDGCIAMKCSSCDVAFCWLCFQPCGRDAHRHCRKVHGGYFPPRNVVNQWHRRLRWRQVDGVLQRAFGERPAPKLAVVIASKRKEALREEALRLCARNLADSEIRLWPFPTVEPSVGGMLEVVPHVQAAQFGRIDELRALLDNTPELIDQANDRGMTALIAAAHGGHAAVVTMLLERGADVTCRDDRGVSALDYAIRENKQEVARALLDCAGAKVEALKKGLNIESAAMLAKIGAEKGIMISGMSRDQTEADFSNQGLQPADTILIGSDLKLMAGVTTLDLSVNRIGDDGAKVIAEALKVNTVLTTLGLSHSIIGIEGAVAIAEALKVNSVLTSVNLQVNSIGDDGAKAIAEALKVNAVVATLSLTYNQIGDEGANAIAEALKLGMAVLTRLDLDGNNIGGDGAKAIAEALKVNAVLTKLELCGNRIGGEGAIAIAEALKVNAVLKNCNLLKSSLDVESATMLAKIGTEKGIMLSGMKRDQTRANFAGQGLQAADAILIGSDLKFMAVLTELWLQCNNIGDDGAKAIAEALKVNTVVTTLYLHNNSIGDEGAKAIAEALKVNAVLTELWLQGSNICEDGAKAIAEALKVNAVVTTLVLYDNKIGPEGAKAIAEALKVNAVLTKLELCGNRIGGEGAIAIAEALKVNAVLKNCNLLKSSLDVKSATMLAKIGTEKGIMLSGMKRDQTRANFEGQGLQAADAILIGSDLKFMAVLTELELGGNKIGDEGAKAIAEALSVNAVVTTLELFRNNIGDEGAKAIAEALKVTAVVTTLSLRCNTIGDEGANAIAEALKVTAVVTDLNLGLNDIGDIGAKAIAEALKVNAVVTTLDLEWNISIGVKGAKAIAEALKANAVLTKLALEYTSMGNAGKKAVRDAVKDRSGFVLEL